MRWRPALLSGLAALAMLSAAACRSPRSTTDPTMPNNEEMKLTWSLGKAGPGLEVRYAVENLSKDTLYLLDQLVVPQGGRYAVAPDRSVVQRGDRPHLVKLTRGFVRADSQAPEVEQGENNPIVPSARPVPAGGRIEGVFHVPLPITPWHPNLDMAPIRSPERAVLELGYLGGAPEWSELPGDGGAVRVPSRAWAARQRWARSDEKALP